ncbi:carbohydrate esterase family 10 protein [Ceratobasidium sp. AG-Ba]|nr:carbohydrate esterase family 10 protein [Ceratobasidium sp. AG-Ba]
MLSVLLSSASLLTLASHALASPPVVKGYSGLSYVGLRNDTANQDYFLGIPFAEPPVGSLRFKPPVPWSPGKMTVVKATRNGPSCVQMIMYTENSVSEDCLTLNIWKPTNVKEKLPVMVYIYGGAFYIGEISQYPGNSLLERAAQINKPIIYVAMSYRVGLYGFPPGKAPVDAGAANLGLKDQRLALEWVQKNIEYFGGDPGKVTIFGASAGAMSAGYQSLYHGGKIEGAFRGMILQSGSPSSLYVHKPNDPVREAAFKFIANATGCLNTPSPFECIRGAPSNVLAQANDDVLKVDPYYHGIGQAPTIFVPTHNPGDDFFTDIPSRLMHSGKFAKVPFINGDQLDEGTVFLNGTSMNTEQDIINWLTVRLPGLYFGMSNVTAIQELLKLYPTDPAVGSPYGTGNDTFGQGAQYKRASSVLGDLIFQASRRDHHTTATKFGVKTWSYVMKERPLSFVPFLGVQHGGINPFVAQSVSIIDPDASEGVLELARTIGDYWVNFAYSLDPNSMEGVKRPNWPKYGANRKTLQLVASNITSVEDTPRRRATDFIIQNSDLYN